MKNLKVDLIDILYNKEKKQEVVWMLNSIGYKTGYKSIDFYRYLYACGSGDKPHSETIQFGNNAKTFEKSDFKEINLKDLKKMAQSKANYKIKVNNEAESQEAQELFFELGYVWPDTKCQTQIKYTTPVIYSSFKDGDLCCDERDFNHKHKEVTLPQLRDLVVLKRNDIKDATHIRCDGKKYLHVKSTGCYYQFSDDGEWLLSTWMNYQLLPQLKPISEQKMASYNIEQQAEQFAQEMAKLVKPRLYLDPTQNYAEIEWDGSFMKQDHWVEVPDGAVEARINGSGGINFINANDDYMNDATGGEWVGTHRGKHDIAGHTIVWQHTQDEPFLTPESVVNDMQQLYPHYYKDVRNLSLIDVYDVLDLFGVTDQAVGHTLKKLLVTGKRGAGKDYLQDLIEARDTLNRAIEICERKK